MPELAALGTTWKAIGSTALTDARDNTGTNPTVSTGVPIYRLDDTRIANNNADLWDGDILAPLNVYQTGVEAGGSPQVWTGTGSTGQEAGSFGIGSTNVGVGAGDRTDDDWVALGAAGNPSHRAWYAVSSVLTVVPELNPGDFNGDLIVDGDDFLKWQREDGTPASLLEWETSYGNDYALAAVTAAVPEPSSFALIAVGLLGMGYRRQKQA